MRVEADRPEESGATKIMLVEGGPHETRVAILEHGRLAEIHFEDLDREQTVGNIYKGRVGRVVPGIEAAFVDIGIDRDGYLFTGGGQDPRRREVAENGAPEGPSVDAGAPVRRVREEIRPVAGREIVVQVVKEALENKGARITTEISLAGRFLVLIPGGCQLGLSRRIEDPEERQRLQEALVDVRDEEMGVIVRTAAEGIEEERLIREYRWLVRRWEAIVRTAEGAAAPALLLAEEELAGRLVRDLLSDDFGEVWVEGETQLRHLRQFVESTSPEMMSRIRRHDSDESLFDRFGVDEQIERALRSRVWLKSGGYLVIQQTEALVAIDVNTGRFVGSSSLEETVVKTNLEAVVEIVRQIRLRDLSGIVVIDFIDMCDTANQEQIMEVLDRELLQDRSRSRVLRISEFGLVELTRKRSRSNLQSRLTRKCSRCGGSGRVASLTTTCRRLRRELLRYLRESAIDGVEVLVHPSIEAALHDTQKPILEEMKRMWNGGLHLESSVDLSPEEFRIGRRSAASGVAPEEAGGER